MVSYTCVVLLLTVLGAGVCHRDVSLENILMDTRIPARGSASRSSSVSSIGSCMSVASNTTSDLEGDGGSGGGGAFMEGVCISNPAAFGTSLEMESEERRAAEAGEWIGRPRLCDFGMSVRIPKSSGKGKLSFVLGFVCVPFALFMSSFSFVAVYGTWYMYVGDRLA